MLGFPPFLLEKLMVFFNLRVFWSANFFDIILSFFFHHEPTGRELLMGSSLQGKQRLAFLSYYLNVINLQPSFHKPAGRKGQEGPRCADSLTVWNTGLSP